MRRILVLIMAWMLALYPLTQGAAAAQPCATPAIAMTSHDAIASHHQGHHAGAIEHQRRHTAPAPCSADCQLACGLCSMVVFDAPSAGLERAWSFEHAVASAESILTGRTEQPKHGPPRTTI